MLTITRFLMGKKLEGHGVFCSRVVEVMGTMYILLSTF